MPARDNAQRLVNEFFRTSILPAKSSRSTSVVSSNRATIPQKPIDSTSSTISAAPMCFFSASRVSRPPLTLRATSSVNLSTRRSRSLKQLALSQFSIASTCASLTPVLFAIGTCWVHSYRDLLTLAVRRIASSRRRGSSFERVSSEFPSIEAGDKAASYVAIIRATFIFTRPRLRISRVFSGTLVSSTYGSNAIEVPSPAVCEVRVHAVTLISKGKRLQIACGQRLARVYFDWAIARRNSGCNTSAPAARDIATESDSAGSVSSGRKTSPPTGAGGSSSVPIVTVEYNAGLDGDDSVNRSLTSAFIKKYWP